MNSIDQLEKQKRAKQEKAKQFDPDIEIEEEKERLMSDPFNVNKSVFDQNTGKDFGGINTQPSVFDKNTVFFTKT